MTNDHEDGLVILVIILLLFWAIMFVTGAWHGWT
jgi:hypothetical protein